MEKILSSFAIVNKTAKAMSRKNHNKTWPAAGESGHSDLDELTRECQRLAALEHEAEEMAKRLDIERKELLVRIGRTCDKMFSRRQSLPTRGSGLDDLFRNISFIIGR